MCTCAIGLSEEIPSDCTKARNIMDYSIITLENLKTNPRSFLTVCIIGLTVIWYVRHLWRKRYLYIHSWKVKGPLSLPIIGCGYLFVWNRKDPLKILMDVEKNTSAGLVKIWLGTTLLYIVSDPNYVEKILTHPKALAKKGLYRFITQIIGEGLVTAPVEKWRVHRKLFAPSFKHKQLESFVEIYSRQAGLLVEELESVVGRKDINLYQFITNCTLDIICETALGVQMNNQREHGEIGLYLQRVMQVLYRRIFTPWYHVDFIYRFSNIKRTLDENAAKSYKRSDEIFSKKFVTHKEASEPDQSHLEADIDGETPNNRQGFLDVMLKNPNFTEKESKDEMIVFLLSGTDTTASSMCCLFTLLGVYPEVQQRVYEEVINIIGTDRNVEAEDLSKMKYTERVIKENLRLYPIGAMFARSIEEDIDLGDYIIPAKTGVVFVPACIHRNPEYWKNPLEFDPDRFLPEEIAKRHPCTYIPFSYGPRKCIGWKYAMMNMITMTATVVRKFKLFTDCKTVEDIDAKNQMMLLLKCGSKVWVERR